ncbi:hypothetical protein CKO35_04745 [Ectothiorhodospira shaposhnikovii]|uniref:hypothetical protein n=1 Tax=Ectothiorhodospira shaposhnikovii TaxID=1054 RepID=UPI001904B855|nr:hypothetical protein [Ectothiorhodospira shaposhnikovii]MBK1672616.1 hypothetical protein [Ectothiorhodospira shaposhnikovii]
MPWWSLHPILLCLLILQWLLLPAGPQSPPAPTAAGIGTPPVLEIGQARPGPGVEQVAMIADRPLFSETRRPPEASPEAPAEAERPAPPQRPPEPLRAALQAVLGGPEGRLALLADPQGRIHRLRPGDELQGWRLEVIDTQQVRFTRNGHSQTLPLRDY